jgi:hypothetical protein
MRRPGLNKQRETEHSSRANVSGRVQMKKHNHSLELPDLAALLDGEIRDEQQLAGLTARMAQERELKSEFSEQRQVKSLLGGLPEYEAPSYLATRVLGEIATRRKLGRQHRWKPWLFAAGGFAACLVLAGLLFTPISPLRPVNLGTGQVVAKDLAGEMVNGQFVRNMDNEYLQGSWNSELPVADQENLDPQMKAFLEFVNEAHGYRVMMRQSNSLSPDLPEAMLVLGEPQPAGE